MKMLRALLVASMLVCVVSSQTFADTIIWDGDAGDGGLWTNDANWSAASDANDDLVFTGAIVINDNDFAANTDFSSILFNAGATTSFTLDDTGDDNPIDLNPLATITNVSGTDHSIFLTIVAEGDATLRTTGLGDLTIGELGVDTFTLADGAFLLIDVANAASTITINSDFIGAEGFFEKTGAGTLILNAGNNFDGADGDNELTAGTILLGIDNALGGGADQLRIFGGAIGATGGGPISDDNPIFINGDFTVVGTDALTLALGNTTTLVGSRTITMSNTGGTTFNSGGGTFALGIDTLSVDGDEDLTIGGAVTGTGGITKMGTGTLLLTTASPAYSGTTILQNGTLLISNATALGTGSLDINDDPLIGEVRSFGGSGGAITAANAVNVNAGFTIVGTTALTLSGTITAGGGFTITQSNTGATEFSGPVALGANILTFAGAEDLEISGIAAGTGGLTWDNTGMLTLSADNTYTGLTTVNEGILLLTGSLDGSATVTDGATLMGDGPVGDGDDVLTITAGGTLSPGASVGTMVVDGDFTMTAGGQLDIEVDTDVALGTNDLVDVSGDVSIFGDASQLTDNAAIRVREEDGDDPFTTAFFGFTDGGTGSDDVDGLGTSFTIIDIDGTLLTDPRVINVPMWTNFDDISPVDLDGLLIFHFVPFEDSLDLLPVTFLGLAGPSGADSINPGIGDAIDDIVAIANAAGTPSVAVQDFIDDLLDFIDDNADGYTDYNTDDWLTIFNETDASLNTVAVPTALINIDGFRAFNNNQTTYLAARRDGDVSAFAQGKASPVGGPMLASMESNPYVMAHAINSAAQAQPDTVVEGTRSADWSGWVKGFGLTSETDTTTSRTGYDSDAYGIMGGVDYLLGEGLIVGVSFGYINTDADFDMSLGDIDVDTYRIGPYVSYSQDQWYVEASATYGFSDIDRTRTTTLTGTNNSDTDADDFTISAGGGYTFDIDDQLSVTPIGSLYFIHYDQDGYTETGPGPFPLTVGDYEADALYSRLGARLTYRIVNENLVIIPEVFAGWEHEYLEDDEPVDASLLPGGVGSFTVSTAEPESDSAFFGGGVSVLINDNLSVFGRYDGLYNGETDSHGLSGGFTLWF